MFNGAVDMSEKLGKICQPHIRKFARKRELVTNALHGKNV